jgi:crossover junction endodeoxyribonuclease RusA
MDMTVFFVDGDPAAQGSKRLVSLRNGRTVMIENSKKVKPWRASVAAAARAHGCPLREGDVCVIAKFRFVRPRSHFGRSGSIRASAPARPGYADCDKLARAICDALSGIAYRDDRQVACIAVEREWADDGLGSGATIVVADAPKSGIWSYRPN